ncbi:MAG: tripartite tricarboxylate transporter substrate binding protein [Burkholderiales bacterium]|nr:tripartite tricarboxylate transporter substrate binding protein [Burkholderiales bacterium]
MRSRYRLAAALALSAVAACCGAQQHARPIRMVVPLAPGGTNDTLGRLIADRLAERLGQQVVVDNRPGGNSTIGSSIVARATPDGHTLLMMGAGHSINPAIHRTLPYDTERDFAPIGLVAGGPYLMVIHPSIAAKSAKEFVAWVKARPNQVSYGSAGLGNPTHLSGALFNIAAGTDMQHVPYKGGSAVLPDLVSGRIAMTFSSISTMRSNLQAARVRPIAVTTRSRTQFLPEVPTFIESGYNMEVNAWYGLLTTSQTPRAIVDRINAALRETLGEAQVQAAFFKQGLEPQPNSADEFTALIRNEIASWSKVVREAGIPRE